jgi:hypothetical protein
VTCNERRTSRRAMEKANVNVKRFVTAPLHLAGMPNIRRRTPS